MDARSRRRAGLAVAIAMAVALVMATGPGILLVNSPESWSIAGLELPPLYVWGLCWYVVEVACVVAACRLGPARE